MILVGCTALPEFARPGEAFLFHHQAAQLEPAGHVLRVCRQSLPEDLLRALLVLGVRENPAEPCIREE